ncbi:MAG TPA: hydroxyisourate hydrolase [Phycisphaerales bacterium]|nr:hydroxyisourate hydrolase [Phycisphaerales bacterium]
MSGISTHILDTSRGVPAAGVRVVLEKEAPGGIWKILADTRTDADGRVKSLLAPGNDLVAASYRMRFATGAYWTGQGIEAFHPHVEVAFLISDPARHHHVPLLVSPFGYTTYRGT